MAAVAIERGSGIATIRSELGEVIVVKKMPQ